MPRIVIFGNTSGGKSTLARRLSRETGIPHVEIDRLFWRPDWTVAPKDEFERQHADALSGQAWIIDGGGDLDTTRLRADRATHIAVSYTHLTLPTIYSV